MGHANLVCPTAVKCGALGIVPWEGTNTTLVASGTFAWQEAKRTVTWCFEFTMRHFDLLFFLRVSFFVITANGLLTWGMDVVSGSGSASGNGYRRVVVVATSSICCAVLTKRNIK